jgi:pimeloyl-ACP methyl ester carboxylesterase
LSSDQTVRDLALPADLKIAEVNGARLAYREQGTGQPVVFVHGSISDLTTWDLQLPVVAAHYRAIAYSRRYAWPNEELSAGDKDTVVRHVDDLLALLRALDALPAHLVGNSYGAFICLSAAIRESSSVRSLVLEEPPLFVLITGAPPSPGHIMGSLFRHPLVTLAVIGMAAGKLRPIGTMVRTADVESTVRTFARVVLGDEAFERLPEQVRAHIVANGSALLGTFRAGFEPISEKDIRSIKAPVLVVTGAQSPLFLRRVAYLVGTLLPDSRSLVVPSATHFMHLQNPSALNAGLLRLLTDVGT